ncbi:growth-regulating factor 4-like [Iris pallida]|uniref:Growth-regulating factor n=1 Tax=Iris pallida TaxID=29817 RepID=A0AAX6DVC6_IRIPA|nr:growth-regulating factor 4-like [Iris pallida]
MFRSPFTASQWQELEHQALILKYLMAGVPVPPDLLLPIRRSFGSLLPARYYPNPTLGYCSYFGKKLDPEPGRCRRTDGKKWRCAKDAYPDSKYCERHMHRSKNRSRKPVESQTLSQSQLSSSTVTSLTPTLSTSGSYQNNSLQHSVSGGAITKNSDPSPYGTVSKDYRYLHGGKAGVDEHSFFSETSGSVRGIGLDSSPDSSWPSLLPSRVSSFPISEARDSPLVASYPQLHCLQDFGHQQQQHSFFGGNFGVSPEPVKHENHSLRPFFDEWPKASDPWPRLEDDRSSFSTTQLSISIPMASSDFSTTTSRSHNDD